MYLAHQQYRDGQLRTLQAHVKQWRAQAIVTFDDQWLAEEVLADQTMPGPLRALLEGAPGQTASPVAECVGPG